MAEIKFNINDPKTGKTYQKVLEDESLVGKQIGDKIKGDFLSLNDYELEITGGSDSSGFPMRKDVEGSNRKQILATKSTGIRVKRNGMLVRKNLAGNTIGQKTAQINLKIIKAGKDPVEKALGLVQEEEPKEEKKEEANETNN